MRSVFLAAIVCCLAFGPALTGQVPGDRSFAGEVAEYDVGIKEQCPADKADTLVVFSATWCGPCQAMRPTWAVFRTEGYRVVYIDIDEPHKYDGKHEGQTAALVDKATQERSRLNERAVPHYLFYNSATESFVFDDERVTGMILPEKLKEKLWKESSSKDSLLERLR